MHYYPIKLMSKIGFDKFEVAFILLIAIMNSHLMQI